jgi:hypothetical protein
MTADATLTVRSPADLIAAVPYLLGFHPQDSLTVVAVRDRRVVFAARHDLPDPGTPTDAVEAEARHVAVVVARQDVQGATVIGHGTADRVTPAVLRLGAALQGLGITVLDVLRVTDGRFWSYLCDDLSCCPPEGLPCNSASTAVAAAATYAGQVALPDRETLAALLAPVTGAAREGMRAATDAAEQRLANLLAADPPVGLPVADPARPAAEAGAHPAADAGSDAVAFGRRVRRAGRSAVRSAFRRHRDGDRLSDAEVAWLGVLLGHLPVRDYAWERIGTQEWQVALWTDVLRRVQPVHVPPVACLLAFAAWRSGQGALAAVAVDRARSQDPGYSMAALLDDVLRYALPPSTVDDWPAGPRPPGEPGGRARHGR